MQNEQLPPESWLSVGLYFISIKKRYKPHEPTQLICFNENKGLSLLRIINLDNYGRNDERI